MILWPLGIESALYAILIPTGFYSPNGTNFVFHLFVESALNRTNLTPMKETELTASERKKLLRLAAIEFGRKGGQQKSARKTAACKANIISRWAKVKAAKENHAK